jgi:hypothetical protein
MENIFSTENAVSDAALVRIIARARFKKKAVSVLSKRL